MIAKEKLLFVFCIDNQKSLNHLQDAVETQSQTKLRTF